MKIIWTDFAITNLKTIFNYYSEKANQKIAHKIRKKILIATNKLKLNPESGQVELNLVSLNQKHRSLVCGNYKVIYKIQKDEIIIYDVFDTRQNPFKMNDKNRLKNY